MTTPFLLQLAGGIALLMWGIRMVRTGINRSFGAELRRGLSASAHSRLAAFASGLGATALMQSSTATALIVTPYAARGLIAGSAALAIMLGADVGTALVVQFLALGIQWLSPLLIAIGVSLFVSSKKSRPRGLARTAIGIGLALLALQLISGASQPLRASDFLMLALTMLANEPLVAFLLAAALTWLSHSSIAMVLLVMSLASIEVVGPQLALVLVLGANAGGAIVPVAMTAGGPASGRRVPIGNLAMRTVGALVCLPLISLILPYLTLLGAAPERLVVNFHLVFNLALAAVFLPMVGAIDRLVVRLLPQAEEAEDLGGLRYLDENALDTPTVALTAATREALRMGDLVQSMLTSTLDVFRRDDEGLMLEIAGIDDRVDRLHEAIKLYLAKLQREELDEIESARAIEVLSFTTNLEHIGDIIDKNLLELAAKKIKLRASFSKAGMGELATFHGRIVANFELAMNVFMSGDLALARRLLRQKAEVRQLELRYVESHFSRIGEGRPESIESSSLHLDVLRDLKRINSHLTSVAYPILERAGELAESRLLAAPDAEMARGAAAEPAASAMPPTSQSEVWKGFKAGT